MFTQEVNVEAMYRATELMFGPDASLILAKLADVIDKAMVDGYEQGLMDGQENLEAACDASFDTGHTHGHADGYFDGINEAGDLEEKLRAAGDEGYIEGVRDARSNPRFADEVVQEIINGQAADHFEALMEAMGAMEADAEEPRQPCVTYSYDPFRTAY